MKSFVVKARLMELAKELNIRVSAGAITALDSRIEELIRAAAKRARGNGRKTIKPQDV